MNFSKKTIKTLMSSCSHKLPHIVANKLPLGLPHKKERWSIGIYTGNSPLKLNPPEYVMNPVLSRGDITDVHAGFVADPFMVWVKPTWYLFFEVLNQKTRRGEIGLATSSDAIDWRYQKIVLAEPFHLSYPYVFDWMNEYYMIPESHESGSIRLYKASLFPTQWSFVGILLNGPTFLDPSIFRHADKWWLFAETNPKHRFDTLRLYYADELLGPWTEHPKSPIINGDAHIARPGGRVVTINGRMIRYAQDCFPEYGMRVRAFEMLELNPERYQEREIESGPVLSPSGQGWNAAGMHHIDPHQSADGTWIACVDGRIF
ncbi:MAG: hypothetical protein HC852_14555 [Acaryochloridaceae cyanobacterium RU_4_10]|nr:hypothetical protein [Acaryochloridaceae cyanobacterium RU_4_10]